MLYIKGKQKTCVNYTQVLFISFEVRISNGSSATNIPIHPARYEYGKASMPRCKLNTSGAATITRTVIFTRLEMSVIFKSPIPLKKPWTPLVKAGRIYMMEIKCR